MFSRRLGIAAVGEDDPEVLQRDQIVRVELDDTLERDMVTFLLITAVKASLAMIEGSNVGVGFELQVGDIVQPAYDYVDFFWRAFLYAFMVLGFYKLLLET
ncbi:MAG: hypothetical protein IH969_08455, partial [Candidatus Krumholzibacteriota bacterium]|nr:hypothetical protein [Candidatus Krumholzibacteriota bacterium]